MKKIIIAVAAGLSTVALVACSAESVPAPTVTVTQEAQPSQPSAPDTSSKYNSSEQMYLTTMRSTGNAVLASGSDSDLLEMGYDVCAILDKGYSVDDIAEAMAEELVRQGYNTSVHAEAVGHIIYGANRLLCTNSRGL